MLELKRRRHFSLPSINLLPQRPMQLAPVREDSDELTQAINKDPEDHDDKWELVERPDPGKLEAFWAQVVEDVKNDPEWATFAED